MRASFEEILQSLDLEGARRAHLGLGHALMERLESHGLSDDLTTREHAWLDMPVGTWEDGDVRLAGHAAEALVVCLYALGLVPLPLWDESAHSEDLLRVIQVQEPVANFVGRCRPLPPDDLDALRDIAEAWHWRAQAHLLSELGIEDEVLGLDGGRWVNELPGTGRISRYLPIEDGDLKAFGKPFRQTNGHEFRKVLVVSTERHRGLNWLCGVTREWDGAHVGD